MDTKTRVTQKEVFVTLVKALGDERGLEADRNLGELTHEIAGLGYSTIEIKVWKGQVDALQAKVTAEVARVVKLMQQVKTERKEQFSKKLSVFNQTKEEEPEGFDAMTFIASE